MSTIAGIIQHYQRSIEKCLGDESRLLHCIQKLCKLPVTVDHLQETGIGKTVNALRKYDGNVGVAAKALVTKWKNMVAAEEDAPASSTPSVEKSRVINHGQSNSNHCSGSLTNSRSGDELNGYKDSSSVKRRETVEINNYHSSRKKEKYEKLDKRKSDERPKLEKPQENHDKKMANDYGSMENGMNDSFDKLNGFGSSHDFAFEAMDFETAYNQYEDDEDEDEEKLIIIDEQKDKTDECDKKNQNNDKSETKNSTSDSHHKHKSDNRERESSKSSRKDEKSHEKSSKSLSEKDRKKDERHHKDKHHEKSERSSNKSDKSENREKDRAKERSEKNERRNRDRSVDKNEISDRDRSAEKTGRRDQEKRERHDRDKSSERTEKHDRDRSAEKREKHDRERSAEKNERRNQDRSAEKRERRDRDRSAEKNEKRDREKSAERSERCDRDRSTEKTSKERSENSDRDDKKDKRDRHEKREEKEKDKKLEKSDKNERKDKERTDKSSSKHKEEKNERTPSKDESRKAEGSSYRSSSKSKDSKEKESKNCKRDLKESTNESDEPTPKKVKKTTVVMEEGIDCSMGKSFEEALGMILPPTSSKSSSKTKSPKVNGQLNKSSSSSIDKPGNSSGSSSSSLFAVPAPPRSKTPPLLTAKAKLEPLDPAIALELPTISNNYKPLPLNPIVMDCVFSSNKPPRRTMTDEEALANGISSKTIRTKVYSGARTGVLLQAPSLFDLCIRVLQKNIDALEYTGGVPFEVLKPVLERATPQQLIAFEDYNPYLMEDSDTLWQHHINRHYRGKKRLENESWREMFIRCKEEQDERLSLLTENIKLQQKKVQLPIKKTQLAYIDSAVKPPRGVIRKQEIYGTKSKVVATPAARVAALSNVTTNIAKVGDARLRIAPGARDTAQASSSARPRKAPLMQKTLQFMKGRFKRK